MDEHDGQDLSADFAADVDAGEGTALPAVDVAEDIAPSDEPVDIEELAEVEIGGKRHLIPKALKGGFLMHADYTRKTQALASERAAIAAERQALRDAAASAPSEAAALAETDAQLGQFAAVDWQALARDDPARAQGLWEHYQQALAGREALVRQAEETQMREAHERAVTVQLGHAELAREIPGWSPPLAQAMNDYAQKAFGFTADEVGAVVDPRLVKLLHKAYGAAVSEARIARARFGQATEPAITLRGGGGAAPVAADTDDFAAFERMFDARAKARR